MYEGKPSTFEWQKRAFSCSRDKSEVVNCVQYTLTSSGKKEHSTDPMGTVIKFVSLQCQGSVQVR